MIDRSRPARALLLAGLMMLAGLPARGEETRQWQGGDARIEGFMAVVARTAEEWQALWRAVGKPAPGPLGGSGTLAAAIFLGAGAPASEVRITGVERRIGFLVVSFQEAGASTGTGSPYVIRPLRDENLPVAFQHQPGDGSLLVPPSEAARMEAWLRDLAGQRDAARRDIETCRRQFDESAHDGLRPLPPCGPEPTGR